MPLSKADVPDRITLRYFNCRGRGQALRYLLIDHGVEFADERIEAGPSSVNDKGRLGGPFASLPVLHWAGDLVAQTLPIASYVSRRLGHGEDLDINEAALRDAVSNAAYLDLTCLVRELLRPRVIPTHDQWSEFFADFLATVSSRFAAFDNLLAQRKPPFLAGAVPMASDYFLFEAVDAWLELLGNPLADELAKCRYLSVHRAALLTRPRLRAYLASGERPPTLTASPYESAIRDRLSRGR